MGIEPINEYSDREPVSAMDLATVCIILINWNGLEDTLECLTSLRLLTYPRVNIVVVDNASKGNQADIIEERFPEVMVLRQSENLGFCGGCNVGIQYAIDQGGDFVLVLNNDTVTTPDLLEKLIAVFQKISNAGAVSPVISEYPEVTKIGYFRPKWNPKTAVFVNDNCGYLSEIDPFPVEFANGCCMLVPVRIFQTVGLFDERYFAYYDEIDWCCRIRRHGYESYVAPTAMVHHKMTRSTPAPVRDYFMSRNRLLWMKENLSFWARLYSFKFLLKDYIWHILNSRGLTTPRISRQCSRAVVSGGSDYFRGRFYKWDEKKQKAIVEM